VCGMPMQQVCECRVSAASIELDQLASQGPVGQVRGPRIGAGVLGGQRDHDGTWDIHEHVCACEPGECHVDVPALVTFCLCQPMRRRGLGCQPLLFVCVLYVGAVEGCDQPCWCHVCAVSLGHMLSFTTG